MIEALGSKYGVLMILGLILLIMIAIIILIRVSSKSDKNINLKTKIGNNEFGISIGDDSSKDKKSNEPKPPQQQSVSESQSQSKDEQQFGSISNIAADMYDIAEQEYEEYMKELYVNYLEAHIMFTFGFNHIKQRREDINDKIYIKLMKKHGLNPSVINKLIWYIPIIKDLISTYSLLYKEYMSEVIEIFKADFDDMNNIDNKIEELIKKNEAGEFIKNTISFYKSKNAEVIYYQENNLVDVTSNLLKTGKLFDIFEKRLNTSILDFVADLKISKVMLSTNTSNPVSINSFCVMSRITRLFDFIAKHLCIVYTEVKPAVLGDIIDEINKSFYNSNNNINVSVANNNDDNGDGNPQPV